MKTVFGIVCARLWISDGSCVAIMSFLDNMKAVLPLYKGHLSTRMAIIPAHVQCRD